MSHINDVKAYKNRQQMKGLCPDCGRKRNKYVLCDTCHDKHMKRQKTRMNLKKQDKEYW